MYYKFNSGTNHSELKYIPQIKDLILDHRPASLEICMQVKKL